MAKHFKPDPSGNTEAMERPYESVVTERRVGGTGHVSLPYGQAATYHYSYPSAAVRNDDYYDLDAPPRGGLVMVARFLLLLVAWLFRLVAFAFFVLVVLNVVSITAIEVPVTRVTDIVTSYLPWRSLGLLEVETPFGGIFRGDLSLVTLLFFVLDWLVCRLRMRMR